MTMNAPVRFGLSPTQAPRGAREWGEDKVLRSVCNTQQRRVAAVALM